MEEKGEMGDVRADFRFGKTFKYYFQCRRADIFVKTWGIFCTQFGSEVRVGTEPPFDGPRRDAAIFATGKMPALHGAVSEIASCSWAHWQLWPTLDSSKTVSLR